MNVEISTSVFFSYIVIIMKCLFVCVLSIAKFVASKRVSERTNTAQLCVRARMFDCLSLSLIVIFILLICCIINMKNLVKWCVDVLVSNFCGWSVWDRCKHWIFTHSKIKPINLYFSLSVSVSVSVVFSPILAHVLLYVCMCVVALQMEFIPISYQIHHNSIPF